MSDEPEAIAANNVAIFLEKGPGFHKGYGTFVVAKDSRRKRVLIGGLGGMGVGEMWFDEKDRDKQKPGYAEAPEMNSTGGFGVA